MRQEISSIVARFLWETQAIKVSADRPFLLVSRNRSPIYIDCRVLISHCTQRTLITEFAHWLCESKKLYPDYIAGGETAGIPYAAWLAQRVNKPLIYVRKKPKGHGTPSQIEGDLKAGSRVLLFEDLITTGLSKLNFIDGIEKADSSVEDCLVIFDRQQGGEEVLSARGVSLHSLCDLETAIRVGREEKHISAVDNEMIDDYLRDPRLWHIERGYDFFE